MGRSIIDTPTGPVQIRTADGAVIRVGWLEDEGEAASAAEPEDDVSRETSRQLKAYFAGELTDFTLPVRFERGTAFERAVWQAMLEIPYGQTRTYGDLAHATQAIARAVGTACGRNPIPIIVPCHRVVGAGGTLVGFSGGKGVETKSWLLDFERGQSRLF
jgi:methylated-DNA-[protein]-cysteine S-methyltransferase